MSQIPDLFWIFVKGFEGMVLFLAFSTVSGRCGTAQERGARGLIRFRANEAKTCIFVFFEHFSELARAARDTKFERKNFFVLQHLPATP